MNKMIIINDNNYDLELLSKQSDYFLAMYNFEINTTINLTHRGKPFEIIIKILLDKYIYDEDYIIYNNEIMEIKDELMLNHKQIMSIEEICEYITMGILEKKKINTAIWRYQNNKLTKKQKKSPQYNIPYWKNIHYLDLLLTYEQNENIYKQNNSLKSDRYEGELNFDIIKNTCIYKNLLQVSKFLIFNKNFFPEDILIMEKNFDLYLNNICLNSSLFYYRSTIHNNYQSTKSINLTNYINKDKIIKLYLDECYFYCEKIIDLQQLLEYYITSNLPNLEYIEIKKLIIKKITHDYMCNTYIHWKPIPSLNFKNIKLNIDEYYKVEIRYYINADDLLFGMV